MGLTNIGTKLGLLKKAISYEESIDEINGRLTRLEDERTKLEKLETEKKNAIDDLKNRISNLNEELKGFDSAASEIQDKIQKEELKLAPLKKKWNELEKEVKTLIKYFGEFS